MLMSLGKKLYYALAIQALADTIPVGVIFGLNTDIYDWMVKDGSELLLRTAPFAILISLREINFIKEVRIRYVGVLLLLSSAAMYITNYLYGDQYDTIFDFCRGVLAVLLIYFLKKNKEK
jgi:hypothetical protein